MPDKGTISGTHRPSDPEHAHLIDPVQYALMQEAVAEDTGTPGSQWYEGSGAPDPTEGSDGDFYLDTDDTSTYSETFGLTPYSTFGTPMGGSSLVVAPPAIGSYVDVLNIPPGTMGPGIIKLLHLDIGNNTTGSFYANGRIKISYDNGVTWPFDTDMGSLFLTHYMGTLLPASGWTKHFLTQQMLDHSSSNPEMTGILRYPIPFQDGIIIRLYSTVDTTNGSLFSEIAIEECSPGTVPNYQLESTGAGWFSTGTNIALDGSGGAYLTASDIANNGYSTSGPLSLAADSKCQIANLTGAGWIVGVGYVAYNGYVGPTYKALERPWGIYVDGATGPTGPSAYGSPTLLFGGTEDFFGAGWYGWGLSSAGVGSSPIGTIVSNPSVSGGRPAFTAFLDVMEQSKGWRYNTSLEMWLLEKSLDPSTFGIDVAWCVLYYRDLT